MKNSGKTILFAIFGGLLGGMAGAVVFVGAGYAIAELLGIDNRETQAYFRAFLAMPLGALIGLVTGATAMVAISAKSKAVLLSVAMLGTILLLAAVALGIRWETPRRSAQFRVENQTAAPLERTYMGHDFRRATSLGSIAPGAVSGYHTVDLEERGSFNGVRAVHRGGHIQLTLDLARQTSLVPGSYTYLVREQGGKVTLEIVRD
ncbi:MAG: hypothetical protein IT572_01835 [Deltaproteobacteria bacterium]|nr:hypothetical protein [Deltaproteobacteria bacterium]